MALLTDDYAYSQTQGYDNPETHIMPTTLEGRVSAERVPTLDVSVDAGEHSAQAMREAAGVRSERVVDMAGKHNIILSGAVNAAPGVMTMQAEPVVDANWPAKIAPDNNKMNTSNYRGPEIDAAAVNTAVNTAMPQAQPSETERMKGYSQEVAAAREAAEAKDRIIRMRAEILRIHGSNNPEDFAIAT